MNTRFNTNTANPIRQGFGPSQEPKPRLRWRQLMAGIAMLGLSACIMDEPTLSKGSVGYVSDFMGGVVADEPRAALVGRDVLSSGGSAADAVTAVYFALSATLPSRAGLSGGGMCLSFDAKSGDVKALDFTTRRSSEMSPNADRPSAIPGNPRGFFALQARYGVLDWRAVIAPAEKLARFGFPVSRALAQDLQAVGPALIADHEAHKLFAGPDGRQAVKEGQKMNNPDLAAVLGMLRARGAGAFYIGPFANQLVEHVHRAGGTLGKNELRSFIPQWVDTVRVDVGFDTAHFALPPALASTQAGVMLAMILEDEQYDEGGEAERSNVFAEIAMRSFADRETWLDLADNLVKPAQSLTSKQRIAALSQGISNASRTAANRFVPAPKNRAETGASTSFAAVDQLGNAAACSVSMNANFGTGRVARGTGMVLSASPASQGRNALDMAPMMLVNENSKIFRMTAVGSGPSAATALASVLGNVLELEQNVREAIRAPRVHADGDPETTYVETGISSDTVNHLSSVGHTVKRVENLGLVHVLSCPDGLPTLNTTCEMAADPRGFGLAAGSMIK